MVSQRRYDILWRRYNFYKIKRMSKVIAFLGILVVAGTVAVWKFMGKSGTDGNVTDTKGTTGTDLKAGEKKLNMKTSYKNPAGEDEVGFTVTVNADGMIIGAATEVFATHDISKKRQEAFASGFSSAITGKKLSELTAIDRVGGSSLTTGAFNAALPQLQSQL